MLDLWYKNAVFYCLDVETFMDANGDGVGDFQGLTDRLDHLEELGVTCVWLNPFYPSPNRDNGYDISDFYGVDPRLGDLGDFVRFSRAARDRGMRIIVDLVVNHTSVDHPWFQSARSSPDSPHRDWYVWSKEKPKDIKKGIIFPGVQEAVWTYDKTAKAWYMHRFYAHQADLNIANPMVREEIEKIMGYWLELGVSGFRIDAVPFLVEYKGLDEEPDRDPLLLLSEMRDFLSWRRAGGILLAEANVPYDKVSDYFGGRAFGADERMHMIFDFPLNQKLFLGLTREEAGPIAETLKAHPELPLHAQWGTFLRNHDEIDLGRLSDDERAEVFAAMGPEKTMQIYDRGLRRRLAPMLGGDHARIAMAFSLLFALPGSPVLWYGDEIGMGEDLALDERNAVRLPMQWADERNGGFSDAEAGDLVRPVLDEGAYGHATVNVAAQRDRATSLMGRVQRMIRTRRACPEVGWGDMRVVDTGDPAVLGLAYGWRGNTVVTLHNLSRRSLSIALEIDDCDYLTPLLGCDERIAVGSDAPIVLGAYEYRWYRVDGERR